MKPGLLQLSLNKMKLGSQVKQVRLITSAAMQLGGMGLQLPLELTKYPLEQV